MPTPIAFTEEKYSRILLESLFYCARLYRRKRKRRETHTIWHPPMSRAMIISGGRRIVVIGQHLVGLGLMILIHMEIVLR